MQPWVDMPCKEMREVRYIYTCPAQNVLYHFYTNILLTCMRPIQSFQCLIYLFFCLCAFELSLSLYLAHTLTFDALLLLYGRKKNEIELNYMNVPSKVRAANVVLWTLLTLWIAFHFLQPKKYSKTPFNLCILYLYFLIAAETLVFFLNFWNQFFDRRKGHSYSFNTLFKNCCPSEWK